MATPLAISISQLFFLSVQVLAMWFHHAHSHSLTRTTKAGNKCRLAHSYDSGCDTYGVPLKLLVERQPRLPCGCGWCFEWWQWARRSHRTPTKACDGRCPGKRSRYVILGPYMLGRY